VIYDSQSEITILEDFTNLQKDFSSLHHIFDDFSSLDGI